jgi:hypothetical protein
MVVTTFNVSPLVIPPALSSPLSPQATRSAAARLRAIRGREL